MLTAFGVSRRFLPRSVTTPVTFWSRRMRSGSYSSTSRVVFIQHAHFCSARPGPHCDRDATERQEVAPPPNAVPKPLPVGFLDRLRSDIPGLAVSTNAYDLESHGKGESYHPCDRPGAVLYPRCTDDVVAILRRCCEERVPVIPYGAGTSLEGHVGALYGGVSLDMSGFDAIDFLSSSSSSSSCNDDNEIDSLLRNRAIRVGAGVRRNRLNEALRHTGLRFMVDPGADATIGGMVACGASGTAAVRYGTIRQNVLGLECVLADGTVATCGTTGGALKSSAGYDLVGLVTGSEGTLAVITSVVVKLHPVPENVTAAVCSFESLHDAAEAVSTILMMGVPLERCELLDASSIRCFNEYAGQTNPNYHKSDSDGDSNSVSDNHAETENEAKPTLFLEFAGPTSQAVRDQVDLVRSLCTDDVSGSASRFAVSTEESQRRALWEARHKLYYAAIHSREGARSALVTDACVPLSRLADLLTATASDVERLDVVGVNFGHAGDGNVHCILPIRDDDDDDYRRRVHEVNANLIARTIDAGGTCTGEHGIGYGKKQYLVQQFGPGGVEFMRRIKQGIDPHNIMNPGKIV